MNNDLISRQAAIDALRKMQTYKLFSGDDMLLIDQAGAQTELMLLPSAQPEPCEDAVSRKDMLAELDEWREAFDENGHKESCSDMKLVRKFMALLPSAQPEIIRCRECKFASGDSRICMKFDHSPIGELDFCSFAERREVNNESN